MLGDQIYADEPSPALQAAVADRARPADVPDDEVADFGEYALAYHEAWSEPVIRWLLSTVPTTMIFDDHEIHAEWRISQGWMDEMTATSWFRPAHRRRADGVLGLPAPGEPRALGSRPLRAVPRGSGRRGRRCRAGGADGGRRAPDRPQPLELRPAHRRDAARRHRLTCGARRHARAPRARAGRGVGVDRRAGPPAGAPSRARQLRPVPARARPALRRGVGRGADRRRLGPADVAASASGCDGSR